MIDSTSHYKALEALYQHAKIQQVFRNSTIQVAAGKAEISLPIHEDYFHAANSIHGSIYFKLLDDAAYFAAASMVKDVFIVTSSFQLNLLRPVTKGIVKSVGKLRSQSKNLLIAEATLYDEKGKEEAFGTGQFMRSTHSLSSLEGYNTSL